MEKPLALFVRYPPGESVAPLIVQLPSASEGGGSGRFAPAATMHEHVSVPQPYPVYVRKLHLMRVGVK